MEGLGYVASTGRAYTDADEGKSRELDVLAYKLLHEDEERRLVVALRLLVECKNTAAPLAFLTRPTRSPDRPEEVLITYHSVEERFDRDGSTYVTRKRTFDTLGLRDLYWGTSDPVKAVHVSRLERRGTRWNASNTGVFDSLTWPMAKALRAFKRPWHNRNVGFDAAHDWSYVLLFIPIVVVASKLFVADGTQTAPDVQEAPHVRFQREFKAKDLTGTFEIDFVQRDAIVDFVRDTVDAFGTELVRIVEANPDAVIPRDKWPMADIW
ncbi:MAG TPA: hypothetical protein VNB24_09105 [Acidimicrobiales bacterium]|nr:hypothetical protein [Acidimicrobiales bacterium]